MRAVWAEIILQIRTVCCLNEMQMFIKQLYHLERTHARTVKYLE